MNFIISLANLTLELLFHNFLDYFYDRKKVKILAGFFHKGMLKFCKIKITN